MFDGSSIAGWKAINESDMMLMPDPVTGLHRSVLRADDDGDRSATSSSRRPASPTPAIRAPSPSGPRPISSRPSVGDTVFVGPEAEFFIFDDVRFSADPYNTGFELDSIELPTNIGHRLRGRQPRPPAAHQGRLFPGPAGRQRPGHALARCSPSCARWASKVEKHHHEVAVGPARTRHEVRHADADGRPHADLQVRASTTSPKPTARRRPSCRSRSIGDNGSGMHVPPVDLEGAASRCSPATTMPTCRSSASTSSAASSSTPRRSTPSPTRHQLLQAAGAGLRGAGAARLFGAQPLGLVPHPVDDATRRPSASRSASPIRWPTPICASRRC